MDPNERRELARASALVPIKAGEVRDQRIRRAPLALLILAGLIVGAAAGAVLTPLTAIVIGGVGIALHLVQHLDPLPAMSGIGLVAGAMIGLVTAIGYRRGWMKWIGPIGLPLVFVGATIALFRLNGEPLRKIFTPYNLTLILVLNLPAVVLLIVPTHLIVVWALRQVEE